MLTKPLIVGSVLLISLYVVPSAFGQWDALMEHYGGAVVRSEILFGEPAIGRSVPVAVERADRHSVGLLSAGGAAGYALGAVSGAVVGYLIDNDAGESWIGVTDGMLVGSLVGGSPGAPAGVFVSNGRRGNVLVMVIASSLLQLAAVPLLERGSPLVLLLPLSQIGASVALVGITSQNAANAYTGQRP